MDVKHSDVVNFLRRNYTPFMHLSEAAVDELQQAVRIFELRCGEQVRIRGGRKFDYLCLIDGMIGIDNGVQLTALHSRDRSARPYLMPDKMGMVTITANENTVFCHVDSDAIDHLLSWDELTQVATLLDDKGLKGHIQALRNSLALRRLPFEAVEEAFRRMQRVSVRTGQEVVVQGEKGDSFYLILEGEAEVWQQGLYDDSQQRVATLKVGDAFGEESLVIGGTRNATVRMVRDGQLLTLAKADFDELVASSTIDKVGPEVAHSMIAEGSRILDVRYEEEYDERYVPGSIHIPLPELRKRIDELNPKDNYVVMCAGGKRASVANLLLRQRNFRAVTIDGGINAWPYETLSQF